MLRMILTGMGFLSLTACVSQDAVRDAVKKDPKIVFDVIEENPNQFMEVINRAAMKAREMQAAQLAAEQKSEEERDLKQPRKPGLKPERRLIGDGSENVVVVEYADFQCPACRMAHQSLKKFKDKRKIQFYYKHMPLDFHKMAYPSAAYFEAIRLQDREKAMRFYDFLFDNQRELSETGFLDKAARMAGADMKRLAADVKSDKVKRIIEEDMAEFQKFGFTGTPVVIVNGVTLNGAQPPEQLERIAERTTQK